MKRAFSSFLLILLLAVPSFAQNVSTDLNERKQRSFTLVARSATGAEVPLPGAPSVANSNAAVCDVFINQDQKSGVIKYVAPGLATITITVGTLAVTINVTCNAPSAASLSVTVGPEEDQP